MTSQTSDDNTGPTRKILPSSSPADLALLARAAESSLYWLTKYVAKLTVVDRYRIILGAQEILGAFKSNPVSEKEFQAQGALQKIKGRIGRD